MRPPYHLDDVEETLQKAGFSVSRRCIARPSCFDLASRKDDQTLLIKGAFNLANLPKIVVTELRKAAHHLSATPLLVSERASKNALGDDTVYLRHGVQAVTSRTFTDAVIHGRHPLVEAKPGGFYVQLDEGALRSRRIELGLSLGELASMIGVSRRTIYGYERGLTRASVEAALRLERALGVPAVLPIDIFRRTRWGNPKLPRALVQENEALGHILSRFSKLGFSTVRMSVAPFDFIAQSAEGELIIGVFVREDEDKAEERVKEAMSTTGVMGHKSIMLGTEEAVLRLENTLVPYKRFLEVSSVEELPLLLR